MKTCKDFDIKLCYHCENNFPKTDFTKCFIILDKYNIKEYDDFNIVLKVYKDILKYQSDTIIYFLKALESFPELNEKINKLIVLL
jgi:hypothetical protein